MSSDYSSAFAKMEKPSEETIKDSPWKLDFVKKIQDAGLKFALIWLEVTSAIDPSEDYNRQNVEIVFDAVETVYYDLIADMREVYGKHIQIVARDIETLENLELKLRLEPSVDLENAYKNMTITQIRDLLQSKIRTLQSEVDKEEEGLKTLNDQYIFLSRKLGMAHQDAPKTFSPTTVQSFKEKVENLEKEYETRERKYLSKKMEIEQIMAECAIPKEETLHFEFLEDFDDSVKVTDEDFEKLDKIYNQVTERRNALATQIDNLRMELEHLWASFDTGIQQKCKFLSSTHGCSEETIENFKEEIKRLQELKKVNLKEMIENNKKELEKLWEQCHCGGSIRSDFPLFYTAKYSHDVLEAFETQIERWRLYYNKNKKILDTLEIYRKLKNNLMELELHTKTPGKNLGNDLVAERKRHVLNTRIQRTEEKLLKLSSQYLQQNRQHFLTFGQTIEESIKKAYPKKMESKTTPKLKQTPKSTPIATTSKSRFLTPAGLVGKKMFKPPVSAPTQRRKSTTLKKATPTLPKFKLNESKTTSPNKKTIWKPSRVSLHMLKKDDDDDGSWSEYSEFEKDVKDKNVPRSSSFGKQ